MTTPLRLQACSHQTGAALSASECQTLRLQTPKWSIEGVGAGMVLQRSITFQDFHETMVFVNAVARIAHTQDHHPDMQVSYNQCILSWSTHSVKGLSINDFICAAQTDQSILSMRNMEHP